MKSVTEEQLHKSAEFVKEDSRYGYEADIIKKCLEKFPSNDNPENIALKIALIDMTNSTNLNKFLGKVNLRHYRKYNGENVEKRDFATYFEEIFEDVVKRKLDYQELYKTRLENYKIEDLHNGYFAKDKQGHLKDSTNKLNNDDKSAFELILKDKEKLLDDNEPLRFIFSHSALGVGWDNPNVFNICTLNDTQSEIKKRQEIGRGLRLPVDAKGVRIQDENINILTVIANESYEDFSRKLQQEIEEDTGTKFGSEFIKNKKQRKTITLTKDLKLDQNFKEIWNKIKFKTKYSVEFDTDELVKKTCELLKSATITPPKITATKTRVVMNEKGIDGEIKTSRSEKIADKQYVPDILEIISKRTKTTRKTVLEILQKSNFVEKILINPQLVVDEVVNKIEQALRELMVDGVKYEKLNEDVFDMQLFQNKELEAYSYTENSKRGAAQVNEKASDKTIWDYTIVDSEVEYNYLKALENNDDIKFYCKLPAWFKIPTPLGNYNPDWAVVFDGVFEDSGTQNSKVYFIAETKGVSDLNSEQLRFFEKGHIKAGEKHFEKCGVDYIGPTDDLQDTLGKLEDKRNGSV